MATITVNSVGNGIAVEGNNISHLVTLSDTTSVPTVLDFSLTGSGINPATIGADISTAITFSNGVTRSPITGQLIVPAGVTTFRITVQTIDDVLLEPTETYTITVGTQNGTGSILQDETPRVTVLSVGNGQAVEGNNISHLVTLSAPTTSAISLPFTLVGSGVNPATLGADTGTPVTFTNGVTFSPITGLLNIPAGVTTFSVVVPTIDDVLVEITESYTLTVGGQNGTGSLIDSDPIYNPMVQSVGNGQAVEGNNIAHLVTLSAPTTTSTLFDFSLSNGTATVGVDTGANITFSNGVTRSPITGQLIVPAGVTSFNVIVPTVFDNIVETSETYGISVGGANATGTIVENSLLLPIQSISSGQATEGSAITHLVTLSAPTVAPISVPFNISNISATLGEDTGNPITFSNGVTRNPITGQLTVPAGVRSFNVIVPTVVDGLTESAETYGISVGGQNATGTILDAVPPPVAVTVQSVAAGTATEGNNIAHLVTLSATTTTSTLFDFSLSNGTATVGVDTGANFTFSNGVTRSPITGQLIVPAGVTTFTVNVPATADNLVEGAETYNLNIGGKTSIGTIQDGLAPLQVLSVSSGEAEEGANVTHLVTLSRATTEPTLFDLSLTNGSASFGIDAGFPVSFSNGVTRSFVTGQLIVPAGVTSFNIIVPTFTDTLTETTETYSIGVNERTATGTITDFVPSNVAVVSVSTAQATEGNTINHNVVLSAQTTSTINLPFSLSNVSSTNGNATLGTDTVNPVTFTNGVTYNANTGQIRVPAGVTNFSVQVQAVADTLTEGSETYAVNVGNQTGFGTIIDPVVLPAVNLTLNPASATEGNDLTHNVVLTNPSTQATKVAFSLTNVSVTLGQDTRAPITFTNGVTYDAESGLLNIPANVSSFDIVIPTVVDTLTEGAETYTIQVGSQTTTGTIRDVIEVMPPPTVSTVSNGTAVEGATIRHTVTLSSATTESTQYLLTLSNGTATLGTDTQALPTFTNGVTYSASTNLMTVPAGVTSFEIIISTIDDALVEANETYSLTVVGSNATGTIVDPDTANTALNAVDDNITQAFAAGVIKISPASLLNNDTVASNSTLTIVDLKNAVNGVVTYDGTDIVFTPNPGYKGAASFEYVLSDGQGNQDTALVSFNVTASFGTANDDQWNGTDLNDKLFGLAGMDTLNGGLGNDEIDGGTANDILNGEAGNDIVFGNDGDDIIRGGSGNDELYGGAGNDTFVWKATDIEGQGVEHDVVKDFVLGDKLDLRDLLQNESYTLESLDNYLHFDVNASEGLKIHISASGSFADNQTVGTNPNSGSVDQTITLSNINLSGAVNNADVIALILANNILVTE